MNRVCRGLHCNRPMKSTNATSSTPASNRHGQGSDRTHLHPILEYPSDANMMIGMHMTNKQYPQLLINLFVDPVAKATA